MIGAILNIRGLGRPGRKQALADLILDYKLEFVGIQETKKEKIDDSFLSFVSGYLEFKWCSLPAKGSAGGILVGLRDDLFEIVSYSCGSFCVSVQVLNKTDAFIWNLIVVYGTAYAEFKLDFFVELHEVMERNPLPTLIGGISMLLGFPMRKIMVILTTNGRLCLMIG